MKLRLQRAPESSREVGLGLALLPCPAEEPELTFGPRSIKRPYPVAIEVSLEVGHEDAIFIRGTGGGLSWDKGQRLRYIQPTKWLWSSTPAAGTIEFQLLLNDQVWERGKTHLVEPGAWLTLTPDFEWPEIPRVAPPDTVH